MLLKYLYLFRCIPGAKDEYFFTDIQRHVRMIPMFELPALPYLLVAVGGAVGSVLRYAAAVFFGARPLTTFAVNILGSFLIGLLASISYEPRTRLLFGTGVLGGFTTFSAWQLEAVTAWHTEGAQLQACVILFGSLGAGFTACCLGYALGQRLR